MFHEYPTNGLTSVTKPYTCNQHPYQAEIYFMTLYTKHQPNYSIHHLENISSAKLEGSPSPDTVTAISKDHLCISESQTKTRTEVPPAAKLSQSTTVGRTTRSPCPPNGTTSPSYSPCPQQVIFRKLPFLFRETR
jgi:hypothetical protein